MSMQAESLEVLEKADLPPSRARAIVRAIEIEIAGAKDVLATKHGVFPLRADQLDSKIADLTSELKAEIRACARSFCRQMYAAILGQTAMLLGIGYFFVTHIAG